MGAELDRLNRLWEKLHAEALQAAQRRQALGALFESAPEACLVTDEHAFVRAANPAAARLLGRNPTGKPLAVFVPLAERREFRRNVSLLATRARWACSAFAADVRRSPGGLCWVLR
jgi:PAS domain-containing protein